MEINQALEKLLSATPENILQQLLQFNVMIQRSDEETTIAIWHTLESAKSMVRSGDTAWQNIYQLQQSVKSRFKYFIANNNINKSNRTQHDTEKLFVSIAGRL